ncbi:MAG TPA: alanine--tRNA ligase-related protein [Verrucomicrobiae bacterium]|nr:alanine--tRNA ligase-related protein [Verrucomicrobiae bacterium]
MATKLVYLEECNVIRTKAVVTKVYDTEDGQRVVELDQTCFYPRGGGQDWDTGKITAGDVRFDVIMVRLDESGVVQHYGTFASGLLTQGDAVECEVDASRRQVNTRLHSAGHLIDMAVERLGLTWVPGKGAHYPHMSFVEYQTGDDIVDETVKQSIQKKLDELIVQGDYENKILFIPVSEMSRYCRHIPNNIPTNKPARIVLYADTFGIPCGGTHVRRVRDIGKIEVSKIKSKKGIIKVSYRVEGVN